MSIYSGFATRQQQQSYDECLQTVVYIMQKRLLRFYKNQHTDEDKFFNILNKMYSQMKHMENHKYLQPKTSRTFQQLILFLKNKQLEDASIQDNKIISNEGFEEKQLNKKQFLPHSQAMNRNYSYNQDHQQRSQRLQVKFNQPKQIQDFQIRPNTTNNKIPKRISSNSNYSHNQNHTQFQPNLNNPNNTTNVNIPIENANKNQQNPTQKVKLQNISNQSALKLVKVSRNQPRTFLYNSNHEIKNKKQGSRTRSKRKQTQQQNTQQFNIKSHEKQTDVHQLIKGYINKTKKSYLKGINKKKDQIDQLFKLI